MRISVLFVFVWFCLYKYMPLWSFMPLISLLSEASMYISLFLFLVSCLLILTKNWLHTSFKSFCFLSLIAFKITKNFTWITLSDGHVPRDSTYVTTEDVSVPLNLYVAMTTLAGIGITTAFIFCIFNIVHRENK